ncbi:MAG TPA: hypothetical protein VN654_06710 [Vicinamibacterales bacterium]|jgi:hypothetical protein|nr:hypothetical protein [Vicinamibacterales bacterium]
MTRLVTAFTLALMTATFSAAQAAPAKSGTGLTLPISGAGSGATFTGTLDLQRFVASGSGVAAVGTLTGQVTNALGQVTTIAQNVTLPVNIAATTCDILHLDIGPIALDLLGLQVNLSEVILDITAQAGAGNLLGNLLCAVAGLLDNPGGLANLLNQILAIL